jgi:hypothetical protein
MAAPRGGVSFEDLDRGGEPLEGNRVDHRGTMSAEVPQVSLPRQYLREGSDQLRRAGDQGFLSWASHLSQQQGTLRR